MSKKIKSFTVEEDLYSAAAKIAKNELKMSVSQLIEHLLSGFVDGHYKVEKKQTLQTVNRPISLTRKQLIYILTTVFSDKGYVLKPHTRDGKCYYEISKDNVLLCVCMIVMRDMRHTSCVYQVSADLTAPLLNYVQEKNILFSSAGVKIAPILFTYAITPNNIFISRKKAYNKAFLQSIFYFPVIRNNAPSLPPSVREVQCRLSRLPILRVSG